MNFPLSTFTDAQRDEWLRILKEPKDQPHWFVALPPWEQNYFQTKVGEWYENINPAQKINLGDFLGSVPSTIRRYPGSPNAYYTKVNITGEKGTFSFSKIRSGVLAPVKMSAKSQAQKDQKSEITRQNMEQLLVVAIKQKLDGTKPGNEPLSFPILLQTLYSPPFSRLEATTMNPCK